MLEFDHVVVSAKTLPAGRSYIEDALQLDMVAGGEHDIFQTHNALLGLEDGIYLEAIAANPNVPEPTRPRWFDLDRFDGGPRVTNWACRTDDLEAVVARFPEIGDIVSLSRGDLRWRMAVPKTGALPFDNLFPAVLQWDVDEIPQDRLVPKTRLTNLRITHPWASALVALLEPVLDDGRVVIAEGPAALEARFDTGEGVRVL